MNCRYYLLFRKELGLYCSFLNLWYSFCMIGHNLSTLHILNKYTVTRTNKGWKQGKTFWKWWRRSINYMSRFWSLFCDSTLKYENYQKGLKTCKQTCPIWYMYLKKAKIMLLITLHSISLCTGNCKSCTVYSIFETSLILMIQNNIYYHIAYTCK